LAPDQPLPGETAWRALLPEYRRLPADADPTGWRSAAVLILLRPVGTGWRLPLIVRPAGAGIHAGQVALPGGALELGETAESAALRECHEELGIQLDLSRILRRLTPLPVPPSRYLVTPVVALLDSPASAPPSPPSAFPYRPSPAEVAAVFECELAEVLDPAKRGRTSRWHGDRYWEVPCLHLGGYEVWGATAMILAELAALLAPKNLR